MRLAALVLAMTGLASGALPAVAQQSAPACVSRGVAYRPGETVCIPACHGRQRLARCDMAGNVASWTTLSDSCPVASVRPEPGATLAGNATLACLVSPVALQTVLR